MGEIKVESIASSEMALQCTNGGTEQREIDEMITDAEDPLLPFLPAKSALAHVREALLSEGFFVLRNVLTNEECENAVKSIFDFAEDISSGSIDRSDASTWYPNIDENTKTDPWPLSTSGTCQSLGAGYVLGDVREALAERVFEPLYQTRKLHCSKEGFTFHRPTAGRDRNITEQNASESLGERYYQSNESNTLQTIQSLVALEDQEEDADLYFLCYPKSHAAVHKQKLPFDNHRHVKSAWIHLDDNETHQLKNELGLLPKRVYLSKGDVIVWRSDLVHSTTLSPASATSRFRAVAYTSMQPSCLTPNSVQAAKMDAYRQRRTGDHRPHVENWYSENNENDGVTNNNINNRPYYRTSPPLVTTRLAELYGLLPYTDTNEDQKKEMDRAQVRGVRFIHTHANARKPLVRPCPARLEHISASRSDRKHMAGQDKYLGGMVSPCGTYIYGVPGTSRRVVRLDAKTNKMDWIGDSYEGKFKWLRGVEVPAEAMNSPEKYPNGCCIALPCNATNVLKINPATNEVYTFGEDVLKTAGTSGWYYHGGDLADNGFVYAVCANADRVAKINPVTDEVTYIGPVFEGGQKWFGGIMGEDRKIYGIPHNEVGVLQIDPETDSVNVLYLEDGSPLPKGKWKWHGGLAAGPKIYGYPNNSDTMLVVDTRQGRVYTIGDDTILQSGRHRIPQDGRYKYLGGALTLDERYLYLFPCDAERVLRVDTHTDELKLVGPDLLDGENKFQNGFVGQDGCLYGIPQRAAGILRVTPPGYEGVGKDEEEHVDLMYCGDDMVGTKDKFEGGVMGVDGSMYCIPLRARTCVKIIPGPPAVNPK